MNGSWLKILVVAVMIPLLFGSYLYTYFTRETIERQLERIEDKLDAALGIEGRRGR